MMDTLQEARAELWAWFEHQGRNLPWRKDPIGSRNPYHVLVAEIMLQQTQVKVVIPYFERWLQRFPNWQSLAEAAAPEVDQFWAGLGYYRRARALHALSKAVVSLGALPQSTEELLKLPGIGPYTAGAVQSLAWNLQAPILDGNLIRVFSRLMCWDGDPSKQPWKKMFWDLAQRWANCEKPGLTNEALMELGATLCTPQKPLCGLCPLSAHCSAYGRGLELLYPHKKGQEFESWEGVILWEKSPEGAYRLIQGGDQPFLKDDWHPPILSKQAFQAQKSDQILGVQKHSITKWKIQLQIVLRKTPQGQYMTQNDSDETWWFPNSPNRHRSSLVTKTFRIIQSMETQ
jgi:A/G-specific adenine glycosylase